MAKQETKRPAKFKHQQVDFKQDYPLITKITNNTYQTEYGKAPEHIKVITNKRISYKNEFGKPFFSLKYHQPTDREGNSSKDWKFVASTGKQSWISYVTDAHGDWDLEEKQIPTKLQPFFIELEPDNNQAQLFDYKTNTFFKNDVADYKKLAPPHPDTFMFEFVFSFEGLFLRQFWINKVALQMVAKTFFETSISRHRWPAKNWELQVALHRNTNNWHIHGRFYQNDKTETKNLRKRPFSVSSLNVIREKIRQEFFINEVIYSNLYNHKLNLYKATDLYKRKSLNDFHLANALLDILNIQANTTEKPTPEQRTVQAQAINTAIKNIMLTSKTISDKNDRLWRQLLTLLNNQMYESQDSNREEFFQTVKNEIARAFKKIYLENIDRFLVSLDKQNVVEWIEQNETANSLAKPELSKMLSQFISEETINKTNQKNTLKREANFHNSANISKTLTFNKIAAWSPNVRNFYKDALVDLGKIFLTSVDIDFTKIELLIKRLDEFLKEIAPVKDINNQPIYKPTEYYEEQVKSVQSIIKNILKL